MKTTKNNTTSHLPVYSISIFTPQQEITCIYVYPGKKINEIRHFYHLVDNHLNEYITGTTRRIMDETG